MVNENYSSEVMDELEEEINKRRIPYTMNSILFVISEGVSLLNKFE